MMLAKVIGTIVCTVKFPMLEGRKLLLLQPVSKDGVPHGKTLVGIDAVGAGEGETVYWCRGREAALAFNPEVISDCSIVGIVDEITARSDEQPSGSAAGPACIAVGPASSVAPASSRKSREHPARAKNRGGRR